MRKKNGPTTEELKVFEEYWKPLICDKKGINKNKLIKELYKIKEEIDLEEANDTIFVKTCGAPVPNGVTKFEVFTEGNNKYNVVWNNPILQLGIMNKKPLPVGLHRSVTEAIKNILKSTNSNAMVRIDV